MLETGSGTKPDTPLRWTLWRSRNGALAAVERALWAGSIGCLTWVLWTSAEAHGYQATQSALLEARSARAARSTGADGSNQTDRPNDPGRSPGPAAPGEPIALLRIPRLQLSAVVAQGVTPDTLSRAVGHVPASALPGEPGNIALAGHRDTFFRRLGQLQVGDRIYLVDPPRRDIYVVERAWVTSPRQVEVVDDVGYPALTLITCYPFHYLGSAPQRFIVRARRTGRSRASATSPVLTVGDRPPA